MCCNLFVLVYLVTPCLVVVVQLCMEWIPIKNIYVYVLNTMQQIVGHIWDFRFSSSALFFQKKSETINFDMFKFIVCIGYQLSLHLKNTTLVKTQIYPQTPKILKDTFINKRQFLAILWTFELFLHFDQLFSSNWQSDDELCTNHK